MSEEENDKPFDPSEQRLRQAREKGDIPRSTEVSTALGYAGAFLALVMAAPPLIERWLVRVGTTAEDAAAGTGLGAGWSLAAAAAAGTLGLMLLPAALVLVGLIAQKGLLFTPANLAMKGSRINPFGNAKQRFGPKGLVTFLISLTKVSLAAAGGWLMFGAMLPWLADAAFLREQQWVPGLGTIITWVLGLAVGVTLAIAGADILWKRLEYMRRHRMSRKEAEDEHKESEGDPHFKALRRQRAVGIAMSTMLADVERADVVIVNPTHYAVALEWKRGSGRAPVCLAKGTDEVAARIRERAREHKVPIWSDPPCARALHAATRIGDEIPVEQFAAVAAAIRFSEAMRRKIRAGW